MKGLACLLGLLCAAGCDDHEHGAATRSICPSGSALTYQSFGRSFVESFCARCHTGADEHPLQSVESLRRELEHIDSMAAAGPAAINTAMPPSAPLPTEAQRRQLGEWLACGAP